MRKLLYQDEAGNKIIKDIDGKICGLNADREIVDGESLIELLNESGIKWELRSKNGIYIWSDNDL